MGDTVIKIENLSKKYVIGKQQSGSLRETLANTFGMAKTQTEEFWALRNINLEIKQGEVVGIIGRNGAGKSTLLKLLSKITYPTSGKITLNGRVSSLLEVGTGFHAELTGRENIFLNGTILGMNKKEIKSKFDEIVDFSGIEKFLDTPVKRYSSGMYVRLAFAVAAHLEPEILIIDEVLAVGDAEFQKKCLGKMGEVAKGGRTVIFVSHNMTSIQNLCNKTIVLKNGNIDFIGSTADGINRYLNFYQKTGETNGNLKDFHNEIKNDSVKIKNVNFSFKNKGSFYENTNQILSGADVLLINIQVENKYYEKEIFLSLDFADKNNIPVFNISNEFTLDSISIKSGVNTVTYEIKNFNMRAGRYFFSIWGADAKTNHPILHLKTCYYIDVIATDFYQTGKIPEHEQHGYFLFKNKCYTAT